MPVIQLRTPADYFGINEAPQQPLFQQTNALQRGADEEMKFFNQMVGLRQQRPLAQAQAIQNQYSTIFNNAEKLRLEQQAAREAEQAVSSLVGIKPESDTYLQQKADIQRQFPLASLDPRVQRIFQENDDIYRSRQSAIAKQQEDMMKRREELQILGVPPDMAEKAAPSRDATAQLKFQYSKGSAKDITGQAMKEDLELTDSRIQKMVNDGTDVIQNKDGTLSPNPKFQSLVEKSDRLFEELSGFYQGKYRPATTTSVAQEAVTTPSAPAPEPAVKVDIQAPLPPDKAAFLQKPREQRGINDYRSFLTRTDLTPKERKVALDELKTVANMKLPKSMAGRNIAEAKKMPEEIQKTIQGIESESKFIEATDAAKSKVKDAIKKISDKTGYSVDQIIASNLDETVEIDGKELELEQWIAKYLGLPQSGIFSSKYSLQGVPDLFTRWTGASGVAPIYTPPAEVPTWPTILNSVVNEAKGQNQVAPQMSNANVGGVPKIQIGTPIKTSS